eukprot:Skav217800  [mRNA]  locus=scaffold1782:466123:467859:- [translate_table: standard]
MVEVTIGARSAVAPEDGTILPLETADNEEAARRTGRGVFDLEENLMKSWPQHFSAAYFCCLSNPQNRQELIGELLKSLEGSPFHRVLEAKPRQMLLLSNLNTPIHSRLWCVYEAHCAYELDLEVCRTIEGKFFLC